MDNVKEINSVDLEKMLEEGKEVSLIDVREDREVSQGMIPGAKHIPLGKIPEAVDHLSKEEEYVIICRAGVRSMRAAEYMQQSGFKVVNLECGMLGWDGEMIFE